jgi:hypothetical protein
MQMKYFLHVLVMGMLFSLHAFSQSANISYINAPLAEVCNTFNAGSSPSKVGGFEHYPYSGGVLYNHTDSAIALRTQLGTSTATNLGTAYAIKYPFKEGYHYTIQIVAWQIDPSQGAIHLDLSLINQLPAPQDSDPISCGGVNQDHWAPLQSSIIAGTYLNNSKSSRNLVNFTFDQAYNYLTVLAWQGATTGSVAFIRQIVINEAPPAYTLAPASVSKVCGTGLSQTFTISDVHNSGKVSTYVWDLGADNNGWLYNGAAAPRFITTTSPSLPLTADACLAMTSNVTARVTRPSGSYFTNTSVITTSNPATLSGPAESCGGAATYTVNNLTCGDVTWSLSPGAIGTLSTTTGPTTTLTTPTQNQNLTVYANIATTCLPKTLSQRVSVITKPTNPGIYGEVNCVDGRIVVPSNFYASSQNADSYFWSWRSPSGSTGTFSDHDDAVVKKFTLGSWTLYCYATNGCGQSETDEFPFTVNQCGGFVAASEREDVSVAVSPNPASNVVVVTTNTTTHGAIKLQEKQAIREIRIIDKTGKLLRKKSFPAGTTTATINVENFKPDIYFLQIGDGKTFQTRKIKISR